MTPQLTTVYVPVDVKKETPKNDDYQFCIESDSGRKIISFYRQESEYNWGGKFMNVNHWLKPITGYFLTQEEMEEVKREAREQAIREAAEAARTRTNDESTSIIVDKQSILNLLNKQP